MKLNFLLTAVLAQSPAFSDDPAPAPAPAPEPKAEIPKAADWQICVTDEFEGHGNCESPNAYCCEGYGPEHQTELRCFLPYDDFTLAQHMNPEKYIYLEQWRFTCYGGHRLQWKPRAGGALNSLFVGGCLTAILAAAQ